MNEPAGRVTAPDVRKLAIALALGVLLLLAASCGTRKPPEQRRYELKGKVESVDKQINQATIEHAEIPGFMPAMTMPYRVKETWAMNVLAKGDRVTATLVVEGERSWLENIVITKEGTDGAATNRPGQPVPGADVPDLGFVNQDGKPVRLHQYHGRAVLLTFIYTRCPLPDFCPLMTARLSEIEKTLKDDASLYQKTHLLSISVDPDYDRPSVLKAYGTAQLSEGRGFDHWEFVSGSKDQVKAAAEFFGLQYRQDQDQIIHSLVTALIGPDGKLLKLYPGNEWEPSAVLSDVRSIEFK
ncbi:MAG TPA: SCO family protein [Blastocatellia bacterium]|nr:SCO family protein [Blastocatellia bacterium]